MLSATIDASVLAAPSASATPDEVYKYVDTLLDWRKLLDQPWVAIYMSEHATGALLDDGVYPFRDALKRLFAASGVVEYDANTLTQFAERLLKLTPTFETHFRLRDVLLENVATDPDILSLAIGEAMSSDLARCVVLIAILRNHCRDSVPNHSLVLRQVDRAMVTVRALIHELEHGRKDLLDLPSPPEFFEGTVLVCESFRGLINNLDEGAVLNAATDEIGIRVAIRIALYKSRLARGLEPEWEDVSGLHIGSSFHETLRRCCQGQPRHFAAKVLRAIIETVDQQNVRAVHALRMGRGGSDPQRMRGRDKAMRRDIDHEYHLHYWQCEDGSVELAAVVVHNDFSIPE